MSKVERVFEQGCFLVFVYLLGAVFVVFSPITWLHRFLFKRGT